MSMENQLSVAQDKIGATERRSTVLESKNKQLGTKVASWTTAYNEQMMSQSNPITCGSGVSSIAQTMAQASLAVPISSVMTIPLSLPQGPLPSIGEVQANNRFPLAPQGSRRGSFGSVFDASSGQEGKDGHNGNGNGHIDDDGTAQTRPRQVQQGVSTFNLRINSKDPPMFHGRATEDVTTWVAKVSDFFYLIEAIDRQQVAYAATLLQEVAVDWWAALLRERYGEHAEDF